MGHYYTCDHCGASEKNAIPCKCHIERAITEVSRVLPEGARIETPEYAEEYYDDRCIDYYIVFSNGIRVPCMALFNVEVQAAASERQEGI